MREPTTITTFIIKEENILSGMLNPHLTLEPAPVAQFLPPGQQETIWSKVLLVE